MEEGIRHSATEVRGRCPWCKTTIKYNILTEEGYDWYGHHRSYTWNDAPKNCPHCNKRIFL